MNNGQSQIVRDQITVRNIEQQIRNNQFENKEQLFEELVRLRNHGVGEVLDNKKMRELLDLFDSMHTVKDELPLDMQKYASVGLEDQNLIVSKEDNRVLTTLEGTSEFTNEFLQKQNEMNANNKDGMVNANAVFESMANHQKEEMTLIPLTEATLQNDIELEVLRKISFFMSNSYVDPRVFKVNINTGIFYNTETDEVYEVKKNENTNEYEIFRGNEKTYGNNYQQDEPTLEEEKGREEMSYESRTYKPKVRARVLERKSYGNNAAFTKVGFLLINIITFGLLITMAILLYK